MSEHITVQPKEPKPPINGPFWLGERLLASNEITKEQFESAKDYFRRNSKGGFVFALIKLGIVTAPKATALVAAEYGVLVADQSTFRPERKEAIAATKRMQHSRAKALNVLPVASHADNILDLCVADPGLYPLSLAKADFPGFRFRYFVAPLGSLQGWIHEAYHGNGTNNLARTANDSPLDYLLKVLRGAIKAGATDVHLELKNDLWIRYRIDNLMVHEEYVEGEMRLGLIQEAKRFGQMDIAEQRRPQHGEKHMVLEGHNFNFRVSCVPGRLGESVVIRIIDESAGVRSFEAIGLYPEEQDRLQALIDRPNGVIYVTGPTGSGKTTMLYSALNKLPYSDLKIITLEQPVECLFPAFTQIPIEPAKGGVSFAEMLREVLRQDPDVILIGETRDLETASITIQASLTGHLCFTTLHTNDASSVPQRLVDMGIEPYMVASSARGFIAQRLLGRLCTRCSVADHNAEGEIDKLKALFPRCGIVNPQFRAPPLEPQMDCPVCGGRGYFGRVSVIEVFTLNEGSQRLITTRATNRELEDHFRKAGCLSMFEDALRKAAKGLTSLQEIYTQINPVAPLEDLT